MTWKKKDRAAIVGTAITKVIVAAVTAACAEVETILREEFEDVAHQTRGERDPPTDN